MSVKREVGVYLFVKEFCFRVRVRVDTNPTLTLTLKKHSLTKNTPRPRVLLATVGTDFAPHSYYRTEHREQATMCIKVLGILRVSFNALFFGSFLILLVFAFSAV